MIHFLAKENDKSHEFASLILNDSTNSVDIDEQVKNQLKHMIDFMNIRH